MFNLDPRWVDISCEGEQHPNRKYSGSFKLRPFLTHAQKMEATRFAEKLLIGIDNTMDMRMFLTTLAFLKFHIIEVDEKVDWWTNDGLDLIDEAPVYKLSQEIQKMQKPQEPETKA